MVVLGIGGAELGVPPVDTVYQFKVLPGFAVAVSGIAVAF